MTPPRDRSGNVAGNVVELEAAFSVRFDSSTSPVLYLGEAEPGSAETDPVWRIRKIDTTSGVKITWAGGTRDFQSIWTNRAGLTYV